MVKISSTRCTLGYIRLAIRIVHAGYLCGVELLTALLLGLAAATAATWFPGMLNLNGVSVSLRAGRQAGYTFSAGMAAAFAAQAAVAVFFARYFVAHPAILDGLRWWAAPVFLGLALFFVLKGVYGRQRSLASADGRPLQGSPFLRGIVVALLNFLTVPYFFAVCGWLVSAGHLPVHLGARLGFTLGAGAGALGIFGAYARMADWMQRHARFLTRNINFVLGGILVVLAVVQGLRMYL